MQKINLQRKLDVHKPIKQVRARVKALVRTAMLFKGFYKEIFRL